MLSLVKKFIKTHSSLLIPSSFSLPEKEEIHQENMGFLNSSRRSSCGYSRVDKEDPDEVKHRKAQFLIYKGMQQADLVVSPRRRRPSWLKVRATKLRIRVGKRIKKLRKSILSMVSCGNAGLHKQIVSQFKAFKNLV